MSDGTNDLGHGSFLDVVTNMVGVLIILVVILGMRIKNAPLKLPPDVKLESINLNLKHKRSAERSVRSDILKAQADLQAMQQELETRFVVRNELSTAVAVAEHVLEQKRGELSGAGQKQYDLGRSAREARDELERLKIELQTLANTPETVEVKCYPTPISHVVDGDELHFQLRDNRVVFVPMEELLRRFKTDAQNKLYKLRDEAEITETVGPVGGFRMRYSLERRNYSEDDFRATGHGGAVIRLEKFELIPLAADLGETIDVAMGENSEFHHALEAAHPGRTTITLWVYPDSFDVFRRLRQELYHRQLAIAGRPMPANEFIGGSPSGTKSSAE